MEPLRIGILGAARIAELAIIEPASATGHRVVAVSARDPQRAKAYAERYGIKSAYGSYQEVIDDPEVEVVYNPWSTRCTRGGTPPHCWPASTC